MGDTCIIIGMESTNRKCATVTLLGRPSSGKSSFLNAACAQNVSIVSPLPQTTRDTIRGIVNREAGQLIFIDTPGIHLSDKKMNLKLTSAAEDSLKENDLVLYIVDATRTYADEEKAVAALAAPYAAHLVAAVNKTDDPSARADDARAFITREISELPPERVIDISAKQNRGVDAVIAALFELAPEGPALYDDDVYTDQDVAFRLSEIIRGQAIAHLRDEIPHAIYVDVDDMKMASEKKLKARAVIYCERESQKGIIIGRGGAMIKQIREESIRVADGIFPYKVSLDISVKVNRDWRHRDDVLGRIIH